MGQHLGGPHATQPGEAIGYTVLRYQRSVRIDTCDSSRLVSDLIGLFYFSLVTTDALLYLVLVTDSYGTCDYVYTLYLRTRSLHCKPQSSLYGDS